MEPEKQKRSPHARRTKALVAMGSAVVALLIVVGAFCVRGEPAASDVYRGVDVAEDSQASNEDPSSPSDASDVADTSAFSGDNAALTDATRDSADYSSASTSANDADSAALSEGNEVTEASEVSAPQSEGGDAAQAPAAQAGESEAPQASATQNGRNEAPQASTSQDEGSDAARASTPQDSSSIHSSSGSASDSGSGESQSKESDSARKITVSVLIDCSRARAYNSKWPSTLGSKTVSLKEGATVYDALCAMDVAVGGSAYYVSSIGGLGEKACGDKSGWMYSVDGRFPDKACGRYELKGGENVVWAYTCDLGNDL